ncbi:MAG TPA: hypothetical protein DHW64_03685 [Chitinophagaceae bacterium]|nr:hypothetical protein [Chitinophagaceae bacterium]
MYNTKAISHIWLLCCLVIAGSCIQTCQAQAGWEVKMVRGINPQNPSSTIWRGFSSTAKPLSVLIPTGIMTVALIEKDESARYKAIEIGTSIIVAAATTTVLKQLVKRDRPGNVYADIYPDKPDTDYSFPSGHVSVSFATAASLSIQYKKWYITIPAYLWGTGVAYSRMYLGQHYPGDVLMGAATGIGSAYLAHWLNKKIFPQSPSLKTK